MSGLRTWVPIATRVYLLLALTIGTIFSPMALSAIPAVFLLWYLYQWRWPINPVIRMLTDLYAFFAVVLLLEPLAGLFSVLAGLPALFLISRSLEESACSLTPRVGGRVRSPTHIFVRVSAIASVTLVLSVLFANVPLILASLAVVAFFAILLLLVLRRFPVRPVEETKVQQRMVAGTQASVEFRMKVKTRFGSLLFIESVHDWVKVRPTVLPLREGELMATVTLSPALSGPREVILNGSAMDRWGLIQTSFQMEPISLHVIPRARFAAWLAKKYLAETRQGTLPMVSNIDMLKPLYGFSRGVEYYGNRPYQPGDTLKHISWKHSSKHDDLIVKEFMEQQGQPAVVLVNLAVGDEEEADKQAYNIIVTALSLARESIPVVLATYDQEKVRVVTSVLEPRQLLLRSLAVAQELVTIAKPVRYVRPPDVGRLRADMSRMRLAKSEASNLLLQLLQMEYRSLNRAARHHPSTRALSEAFARTDRHSGVVVISMRNHDLEALAFNTYLLSRKGHAVVSV